VNMMKRTEEQRVSLNDSVKCVENPVKSNLNLNNHNNLQSNSYINKHVRPGVKNVSMTIKNKAQ